MGAESRVVVKRGVDEGLLLICLVEMEDLAQCRWEPLKTRGKNRFCKASQFSVERTKTKGQTCQRAGEVCQLTFKPFKVRNAGKWRLFVKDKDPEAKHLKLKWTVEIVLEDGEADSEPELRPEMAKSADGKPF